MISESYDFEQFVRAIRDKESADVVCLAEREATEAWMNSYHKQDRLDRGAMQSLQYQKKLLALIDFMRHGIWPRGIEVPELQPLVELHRARPN